MPFLQVGEQCNEQRSHEGREGDECRGALLQRSVAALHASGLRLAAVKHSKQQGSACLLPLGTLAS